jgi:phosphatidylglycerol:prolipoprotein diacylglycerol transferase
MYPTISHLIYDLFGVNIPLPIQTFGFFMAISFVGAYLTTGAELKRKEANGLLQPQRKTITLNQRVTTTDYITSSLIGAVLGYKLIYILFNYTEFVNDTQGFILSTDGNFLGAVAGAVWVYMQKKKEDAEAAKNKPTTKEVSMHPHEHMTNIVFIAGITGLLGAKIFHNLEYIDELLANPIDALLSFSGLTFYGGLIVAAFSVLYYTTRNGIPAKYMIDAAAPGLMLAYAIGRIGCHLSGDGDWGIVNTLAKPDWLAFLPEWAWSYTYPNNVINEGVPIPGCEGRFCYQLPQGVFPTPLYEVIMSGLLFGLLWAIRKRVHIPGMLFSIYLVLNGIERFTIEKIRVNSTYNIFGAQITQAELISSAFVIAGIVAIIMLWRKHPKTA